MFLSSRHKTQWKEEGQAQCTHRPPRPVLPPSRVSACNMVVHVLCRGLSENDTVTTLVLPPLSHKARRKNKKVKAVVQPAQGLGPRSPSVTESRISSFFDSWFFFDSGEILNNYTIG